MAETLVKNPICSKCGENARPNALFCFACGGEIVGFEESEDEDVSSAWFKDDIVEKAANDDVVEKVESDDTVEGAANDDIVEKVENDDTVEADSEDQGLDTEPIPEDEGAEESEVKIPETNQKVKVKRKADADDSESEDKTDEPDLRSAAELRRRPKPVRSKRVEIVWQEESGSPNVLFLVFGLGFVAVFALAFFLTLYLK